MFGTRFTTAQKIALGNNADEFSGLIDDRQTTDVVLKHVSCCLQNRRVGVGRNDIRRHDIAGFHEILRVF